ncbi:MAG: YicC family protein [Clostridiales bacterium]|nr:YicC family protein [Clostridiales bacterium]
MIKSMTGYGSAKGAVDDLTITVELKSVNNKFLDASIRMPRSFMFAEDAVKSAVQRHISRGKIDVFVNVDTSEAKGMKVKVNETLLKGYIEAIGHISDEYSLPNDMTAMSVSRFPDVLTVEKADLDAEAISKGIASVAEQALSDFDTMRLREGEKLRDDVLTRLATIDRYVTQIEQESPKTVAEYRARLEAKMSEVLGTAGIDENRILAEAAVFADHIAVDEETVRLRSHMSQLTTMINGSSPTGRKIDFLIQEFNREANTIGSKCQNSDVAHLVVGLKAEIEKIREQIQNIE